MEMAQGDGAARRATVILSGGMDSTTLLYWLLAQQYKVRAVTVDYGQRHSKEILQAMAITQQLGVPHYVADLRSLRGMFGKNSQTDASVDVPEGHYTSETMKATVVPNRNMILLAVAAGYAIANDCGTLAYGAHAGDHAIYPDCRPEFLAPMAKAMAACDWQQLNLIAPFIEKTKADIAKTGAELGVPFGMTWSCYKGAVAHCGKCGTCVERNEAFKLAGIVDPTTYE